MRYEGQRSRDLIAWCYQAAPRHRSVKPPNSAISDSEVSASAWDHLVAPQMQNIYQRREGIEAETSLLIRNGHLSSQRIRAFHEGIFFSDGDLLTKIDCLKR